MGAESQFLNFSRIEAIAAAIKSAPDMDVLLQIFQSEVEILGFERFTYFVIWPENGPRKPLYITTYRADFSEHYLKNNLKNKDPVWSYSMNTILPFSWSKLMGDKKLDSSYRVVFNEGRDFDLKSGGTIPFYGPGRARAAISVGSNLEQDVFDSIFSKYQHYLQIVGSYLHERMISMDVDAAVAELPNLTGREREILLWVAAGKTNWEISEILRVSENTVKKHIQNTCTKLGVANKTHATAYAITRGYIFP